MDVLHCIEKVNTAIAAFFNEQFQVISDDEGETIDLSDQEFPACFRSFDTDETDGDGLVNTVQSATIRWSSQDLSELEDGTVIRREFDGRYWSVVGECGVDQSGYLTAELERYSAPVFEGAY